jgi:DNA-binding GntR family transcriptional regulator
MALDHVVPASLLSDRIADQLRKAIIHREFKPGDRLKEAEVASQLGVSTIPVREAFGQLEREGLITNLPRRGKFVRALTERDLHDLNRLRALLEQAAYEMICESGGLGTEALEALACGVEAQRQASEAGDRAGVARLDLAFHDRVYREAGSDLLVELWQVLRARLSVLFYWPLRTQADLPEFPWWVEHERILEALRQNDLDALSELARETGRRAFGRIIEDLREERIAAESEQ